MLGYTPLEPPHRALQIGVGLGGVGRFSGNGRCWGGGLGGGVHTTPSYPDLWYRFEAIAPGCLESWAPQHTLSLCCYCPWGGRIG